MEREGLNGVRNGKCLLTVSTIVPGSCYYLQGRQKSGLDVSREARMIAEMLF